VAGAACKVHKIHSLIGHLGVFTGCAFIIIIINNAANAVIAARELVQECGERSFFVLTIAYGKPPGEEEPPTKQLEEGETVAGSTVKVI
jgi:hypothetical protein